MTAAGVAFGNQLLSYELERKGPSWRVTYRECNKGRLAACAGALRAHVRQHYVEHVFRGANGGVWMSTGTMDHWTDRTIRVHAFSCLLRVVLTISAHRCEERAWSGLLIKEFKRELESIWDCELGCPQQGSRVNPCGVRAVEAERGAEGPSRGAGLR